MNRYLICALITVLVTGCSTSAKSPKTPPASDTAAEVPRLSGIVRENVDDSVRAQDDFFRYVNGNWLKKAEIPADKSIWGAFAELRENTRPELRTLIEAAARNPAAAPGSEERKIGDLYASFMDEDTLETLGLRPLAAEFARVAALTDKRQIPALIAHFNRIGADAPYDLSIGQDARASTKYAVILSQSGLGLPDRDYYLKDDDAKLKAVRAKYLAHIEKMLKMAEDRNPTASARAILALETAIAKAQWTKVRNRDPVQTYNRTAIARLPELTPGYPWATYLQDVGIARKVDYVIVSQPSYFTDFGRLWKTTSLPAWKAYFKWRLLSAYARYLPKAYADEHFAFYGTALSGVPQNQARWKRGVTLVEGAIGEGLGKLYVAKYFPPETKAHMERLVRNLLAAYRTSIDALDWMSPATKKEAQAKLARFNTKIGYPNKWRDYTRMRIVKDDLIGNVRRANAFEYQRNIDKLGHSIDREEWAMTPQTVNAYYDPEKNEIVFPAAILQPPFFNAKADDAVNYGAIGAVIGHEISHGFDDQGSRYDGDGNLREWWSKEDHDKFAMKTKALVAQYNAYSPQSGYYVNGKLTLGENIADNSGLVIAYKAYRISLGGKEAPVMDGLTGDQRFFIGWAQAWRAKARSEQQLVYLKIDPHSPPQFRCNGALKNQPGFYAAFSIKQGDQMYLPPEQRVLIW